MIEISSQSAGALADAQLQRNLRHALGHTLQARSRAVQEEPLWEELRLHARRVKEHTLARLDHYLTVLEERIQASGGHVYWAGDADQAADYICALAKKRSVTTVVKSKSMTSEEMDLNSRLEKSGVTPVETDLGEYLVQLEKMPPSHIIAPALHLSRGQAGELIGAAAGIPPIDDVTRLTRIARDLLRRRFLNAEMGISGVNFAVAETGTLTIVENEGNARLSTSTPRIHVAVMGIEKVIPRDLDLAVLLKLLIRSATGQKMTSYVNFIHGPRRREESDGPEELHLILLDNGRTRILSDPDMRSVLSCIRCGACQNVCPVFSKIGGHAYGSTYQGPIGAVLTPLLDSLDAAPQHPFASTLCGACQDVCPMKIELPSMLLELRRRISRAGLRRPRRAWGIRLWRRVLLSPRYDRLSAAGRRVLRLLNRLGIGLPGWRNGGGASPRPARRSFRQLWRDSADD